jgi:segregation and condensation protein A
VIVRELELDLDAFEGPFDLLLTLVLREEVELAELDIAAIVLAFVERLAARALRTWPATAPTGQSPVPPPPGDADDTSLYGAVRSTIPSGDAPPATPQEREEAELDLEACGEFLVLVSALLELKARALFEGDADLADLEPEEAAEELTRRLEEYRRMKEAARWLSERLASERDRFFRLGPAPLAPASIAPRIAPQQPAALAAALRALAVEPPAVSLAHMELRFPPVSQFLGRFRTLLRRRSRFDFEAEVAGLSRAEQAIAFLALLELRRANEIALSQAGPFAPIRVTQQETASEEERSPVWNARSA